MRLNRKQMSSNRSHSDANQSATSAAYLFSSSDKNSKSNNNYNFQTNTQAKSSNKIFSQIKHMMMSMATLMAVSISMLVIRSHSLRIISL